MSTRIMTYLRRGWTDEPPGGPLVAGVCTESLDRRRSGGIGCATHRARWKPAGLGCAERARCAASIRAAMAPGPPDPARLRRLIDAGRSLVSQLDLDELL